MPELHGVTKPPRQLPQEFLQPGGVFVQVRRQLPENGAKMLSQRPNPFKEDRNRLFGHNQLFHVSDEPAAFDRVDESRRRLFTPILHRALGRQAVESIVNFYGLKLRAVITKLLRSAHTSRIKRFRPSLVDPTARSYKKSLHQP